MWHYIYYLALDMAISLLLQKAKQMQISISQFNIIVKATYQLNKADRLTRGTRFTNSKNHYKSKQYNSNPAPRYSGLVPPLYDKKQYRHKIIG